MIASQITTPTPVQNAGGRIGVAVYDNPNVTNNSHASVVIVYADQTWGADSRNNLTQVGTATGPAAFATIGPGAGPGN
jgi:hypothetical protein